MALQLLENLEPTATVSAFSILMDPPFAENLSGWGKIVKYHF
jgi:hypothetical protein